MINSKMLTTSLVLTTILLNAPLMAGKTEGDKVLSEDVKSYKRQAVKICDDIEKPSAASANGMLRLFETDKSEFQTAVLPILRQLASDYTHRNHAYSVAFLTLSSEQPDVDLAKSIAHEKSPFDKSFKFGYIDAALDVLLFGNNESQKRARGFILDRASPMYVDLHNHATQLMKSVDPSLKQRAAALFKLIAIDENSPQKYISCLAYIECDADIRGDAKFFIQVANDKAHKRSREMAYALYKDGSEDERDAVADRVREMAYDNGYCYQIDNLFLLMQHGNEQDKVKARKVFLESFADPKMKNERDRGISFASAYDQELRATCIDILKESVLSSTVLDYRALWELSLRFVDKKVFDEVKPVALKKINDHEFLTDAQYNVDGKGSWAYSDRMYALYYTAEFMNDDITGQTALEVLQRIATNATLNQPEEHGARARKYLDDLNKPRT